MIIIDANQISLFANNDDRVKEILDHLEQGSIKVAIGGSKLSIEYSKNAHFEKYLIQLIRSGRTVRGNTQEIDKTEADITNTIVSDDPHIIALAICTGARLLCSDDTALHTDFKNPKIINKPRGKVWYSSRNISQKIRKELLEFCSLS